MDEPQPPGALDMPIEITSGRYANSVSETTESRARHAVP